ncbi:uncharacterized protein F4822DRAFT_48506 [Hypoxylon trugodes]|uniref:uncharacterized protein n=1 Tax=Hypoxylon trugodes TaxID=326681 RepID=UPI00219CD79F|nr:uncharacterized protein F4822DRAFT_48506 [Hypoxylon trugodes]KAI1394472.1 hypothetical protein F4822DRAFT_48506 [Hypoxylon trugodes]
MESEVSSYENFHYLEIDNSSLASGITTPTRTMTIDDPTDARSSCEAQKYNVIEPAPYPGQTFIIREHNGNRLITLVEGEVRARENIGEQGGWHWVCVEQRGWLGFRNPVSSTYLGHDTQGAFWAKYKHHIIHESFCARRHPNGGYVLLMRHDDELQKMAIGDDGCTLVETTGDGTPWDFIRVWK